MGSKTLINSGEIFSKINILEIKEVNLALIVRQKMGLGLIDSINVARLIKESNRLGVIRGKVLNK